MARRGQIEVPAELGVTLQPVCLVDGCERISYSKQLCRPHQDQINSGKPLKDPRAWGKYTALHPCLIDDCDRPAVARDLCGRHASHSAKYRLEASEYVRIMLVGECENPGCTEVVNLVIDHDHATGAVRGRLCNACNTALGFLKEQPERMIGLAQYVERFAHPDLKLVA